MLNNRSINKILFITLSNIGDVILSLPCLDLLRENFPKAKISVMSGQRPKELFKNNPYVEKLIIYDKKVSWQKKRELVNSLKKEKYDLIIDLRNSMFPYLIGAKYKLNSFRKVPEFLHMKARHLYKISAIIHGGSANIFGGKNINTNSGNKSLYISQQDKDYIENILQENNVNESDRIILIGPGARSHIKRYPKDKFIEICNEVKNWPGAKIVLAGDKEDFPICDDIAKQTGALNFSAKTSLSELAYLLKRSSLVISCDSAIMHLSSYLNKPVVAIFGPTDEAKYGPWSDNSVVVRENLKCAPCEVALCKYNHECMNTLDPQRIIRAAQKLLQL